jgi:hypothetical protein
VARGVMEFEDVVQDYVVYFLLVVLFVGGMITFLYAKQEVGSHWDVVYADLFAQAFAHARPGDHLSVDVSELAVQAVRTQTSFSSVVRVVPSLHSVCVRLGARETCRPYLTSHTLVLVAPLSAEPGPKVLVFEVVA